MEHDRTVVRQARWHALCATPQHMRESSSWRVEAVMPSECAVGSAPEGEAPGTGVALPEDVNEAAVSAHARHQRRRAPLLRPARGGIATLRGSVHTVRVRHKVEVPADKDSPPSPARQRVEALLDELALPSRVARWQIGRREVEVVARPSYSNVDQSPVGRHNFGPHDLQALCHDQVASYHDGGPSMAVSADPRRRPKPLEAMAEAHGLQP
mmetsp:Transcript_5299/g.16069  ORF Transcript_5299/g.16069 Transcript_5299/m.16069 type:complete len:211 (-) Transcript_5299:109-741(-)